MEQRKGRRRILLFPLPLQGHINPMLQLAQILHSNGFSITIIHTHFNSPNPSNYPHFTFCPIPDGLDQSNRAAMSDIPTLLSFFNSSCKDPLEKCLQEMLMSSEEEENNEGVGCLISDDIFHFTQGVAERMKIPRLVLRTGGVCSFRVFAAFNLLRDKGYLPIQDSQLEQQIEELPPLKVKDLPFPIINNSDPQKTYQLIDSMVISIKKSSGLIFNSFEDLEQPSLTLLRQELPCPIFPVGPFHKFTSNPSTHSSLLSEDDDSCITWLDKQAPRSVIYVSFGSPAAVAETETQFNEIAWGLRNSGRPFLWVARPGSVSNRVEPGMVGPEGKGLVVKWAPQMEVLAHPSVGAFWTHCDWDSTLRHEFPCPIFPVGPFHTFTSNPSTRSSLLSEDDDSCITWLDKQAPRSVIYVSFGSPAALAETEFDEIAWGLRNSGRPFLWVVRPGSVSNRVEPGMAGPEGKGLVVKWAPQMEVLAHPSVSAFWTHCGWNSTLEGISEGVPLICMPCFTDQKVNSRFVCDVWKVGLELQRDGIERGKIEGIIKRLFEEKEGEEIRSRVLAMKKEVSDSVREGGSSQQSIESLVRHISP